MNIPFLKNQACQHKAGTRDEDEAEISSFPGSENQNAASLREEKGVKNYF